MQQQDYDERRQVEAADRRQQTTCRTQQRLDEVAEQFRHWVAAAVAEPAQENVDEQRDGVEPQRERDHPQQRIDEHDGNRQRQAEQPQQSERREDLEHDQHD